MTTPIDGTEEGQFVDSASSSTVTSVVALWSPSAGQYVSALQPVFMVIAQALDGAIAVTFQVQVATNASFTTGSRYVSVETDLVNGRVPTSFRFSGDLVDGTTYYWRAREVKVAGGYGDWTAALSFTVDVISTLLSVPGSLTVAAVADDPHVWFASPDRVAAGEDAVVYGQGFGATQGAQVVSVAGTTATVSVWDRVAAGADAYTADRVIDHDTGEITVEHGAVTFEVPEVDRPGGALGITDSNTVFLEVLPPLIPADITTLPALPEAEHLGYLEPDRPLDEQGWEVRVYSYVLAPYLQAIIPRWVELKTMVELDGLGACSVTMDLDDEFFQAPLEDGGPASRVFDHEHIWRAYYNGVCRAEWLGHTVEETTYSSDEEQKRLVTLSGPGSAEVLNWGVVMPAHYPMAPVAAAPIGQDGNPPQYPIEPVFRIWMDQLARVKRRGTIPFVTPLFTGLGDSGGVPWSDTNWSEYSPIFEEGDGGTRSFTPQLGQTLLELLNQLSGREEDSLSPIRAHWLMRPEYKLDVRQNFGSHREDRVILHQSGATRLVKRTRSRDDLRNFVVVENESGACTTQRNWDGSIVRWHQREVFFREVGPQASNASLHVAMAKGILAERSVEKQSWSIQVDAQTPGREVYVDYDVGDWIGIETGPGIVEAFQVLAIACTVNADGMVAELTLQSKMDLREETVKRNLTMLQKAVMNLPRSLTEAGLVTELVDYPTLDYRLYINPETGEYGGTILGDPPPVVSGSPWGGPEAVPGLPAVGSGIRVFFAETEPPNARMGDFWTEP